MSWFNDAHVARGLLGALTAVATAILIVATQTPSAHAASELKEAMDIPMLDISAVLPQPFETGIASTYGVGDGFQGNRTACGQLFDTHTVQVAHKTLKCGTLIRIEDAETGRSVVAEVTDRGPYIRGRIVDLSWAAFRQLDPAGGLRPVNVYLVD